MYATLFLLGRYLRPISPLAVYLACGVAIAIHIPRLQLGLLIMLHADKLIMAAIPPPLNVFLTDHLITLMKDKIISYYFYSAGALLLITATAKIITCFAGIPLLQMPDPIMLIPYRILFLLVGTLELVIAWVCLWRNKTALKAQLVAWLATCFIAYRLGLFLFDHLRPCPCLGNLTDALHISPQTGDVAMKIILAYLLIGSYATLFWLWRQRKRAVEIGQESDVAEATAKT